MQKFTALFLLFSSVIGIQAAPAPQANPDADRIYQFLVQSKAANARPNSGAYLWIPPNTPKIRAVMVGIHNGLPLTILQNPAVRAVCRKYGIAQILLTPNGSEIGPVMLKDLNFDVTDPEKTAVYDSYLKSLAEVSEHPELVTAPIVPLAHSAYCDFPFDIAMCNPDQCLAAMPIKAGLPDKYTFYATGGKAKTPNPELSLRNVPILFVNSASQETVSWSAYPHGIGTAGLGNYRRDHDDNPGTAYEPHNELFGMSWDMMCGHFDMLPRDYQFVADWLDAIAKVRLPERPGDPMKNLSLRDGWLMDPQIPMVGDLPPTYAPSAKYLDYKGTRSKALWFPTEKLARTLFELGRDEPRKEIEMFTFLDPTGQPISLAHGALATMPNPQALLKGDGQFTVTTYHFTAPFDVCTVKDKDHVKHPEQPHTFENVLFPGKTTMPVSKIPLDFDANGGPIEIVKIDDFKDQRGMAESRFTMKLKRHRLAPDAGFTMFFARIWHEGDKQFAAAGRTLQISWSVQDVGKDATSQTVTFPAVPDSRATTAKVELKATSSSKLPVDYFVVKGPGIIQGGAFVPMEVPAGSRRPIEVTIGAYQVGVYKDTGGMKASPTIYQTFHLIP